MMLVEKILGEHVGKEVEVMGILGSLSVISGYFTRFGALLIIIFLIPTTLIFHTDFADRVQMIMFMKNLSMCGGCFILLGIGPGRFSLDYLFRDRKRRE